MLPARLKTVILRKRRPSLAKACQRGIYAFERLPESIRRIQLHTPGEPEAGIFSRANFPMGGVMAALKITVRKNGPYRVEAPEGSIELVDADGNKFDLTGKPAFSLCRCGGSVTKPFCDGTHSRIGFIGAENAVQKAEGTS
jgi:CDGSH-type Zn-finger protein